MWAECRDFHIIAVNACEKLLCFSRVRVELNEFALIFVKLLCFRSSAVGGDVNVSDVVKAAGFCATLYSH
jgi:hypothetical protein